MTQQTDVADILPNALATIAALPARARLHRGVLVRALGPFMLAALMIGAVASVLPPGTFSLGEVLSIAPRPLVLTLLAPAILLVPAVLFFAAIVRAESGSGPVRLLPWTAAHRSVLRRAVILAVPCVLVALLGKPVLTLIVGAVLLRFAPALWTAALGRPMGWRAAWQAFRGAYLESLVAAGLLAALIGIVAELVLWTISTLLPPDLVTGVASGFYGYLGTLLLALVLGMRAQAILPEQAEAEGLAAG